MNTYPKTHTPIVPTLPPILGAPSVPATPTDRPYPVAYPVSRKY